MNLRIKEVRACRNGAYGNFMLLGRSSALITISLKLNALVHEYALTLLHELLHLWVTMLRLKGVKITNKHEHTFIYKVEKEILSAAQKYLRRSHVKRR